MAWRFTHGEVTFVLHNYNTLSGGEWPDPVPSGEGRVQRRARAKFESPCMLAGEVGARVKKCGKDGMLCSWRFGLRVGYKTEACDIAKDWCLPLTEVTNTIKRVIRYCVSEDGTDGARRSESYADWRVRSHR